MKLTELPLSERPREKMMERGASSLSNAELLAVLLRTGSGIDDALDLARKILDSASGSLSALFCSNPGKIMRTKGVGKCKAASLIAAFELGRRYLEEESRVEKKAIVTSRTVFEMLLPRLKGLSHEECWMLFLNNSNYLLSMERLSSGGLDSTVMDVRAVVKTALECNATGVILVHNHPTGNPHPGKADLRQTESLHTALQAFSIDLVDHVIVSDDCFYSMSDERLYKR